MLPMAPSVPITRFDTLLLWRNRMGGTEIRLFLTADATACALAGQRPPEGYYSIERMIKGLTTKKAMVGL
jgi:sulfur relay (sulfurtransferase) complex TusBCD TusD component (DsrE family)